MQTRWRAQQVGLAGFLYVSLDWFSGPRTRERLGAGLQTHTPKRKALTHRKACSRPFVWCRGPLCRRSGFECRPVGAPNRFDLKFERVTKSDRYGPVTGDPLGVALPNHTPIERPAQGLSFGAGLDSLRVQLLTVEPLARPAGLTCATTKKLNVL